MRLEKLPTKEERRKRQTGTSEQKKDWRKTHESTPERLRQISSPNVTQANAEKTLLQVRVREKLPTDLDPGDLRDFGLDLPHDGERDLSSDDR